MTERISYQPPEAEAGLKRDYFRSEDVKSGLSRLVAGLKEDGDEYRMFELMGSVLDTQPDLFMTTVAGSIVEAARRTGQNRRCGSSATLFYPIDAAMRVIAKREGLVANDPLSAASWTTQAMVTTLESYGQQVVELAGSNTTSKNLPQRAAHILWLIDQTPEITAEQPLAFIEIGASGGLILDGLKNQRSFVTWMKDKGYRYDYGSKESQQPSPAIGLDLVKPSLDWLEALVLEDGQRRETQDFIQVFPRSQVITADARQINNLPEIEALVRSNPGAKPFVYSCFVFYQLPDEVRSAVIQSTRDFLNRLGGGYMLTSDIAKYMGYPEKVGGSVAWIENEEGEVISPKIFASKSTLTEWGVL